MFGLAMAVTAVSCAEPGIPQPELAERSEQVRDRYEDRELGQLIMGLAMESGTGAGITATGGFVRGEYERRDGTIVRRSARNPFIWSDLEDKPVPGSVGFICVDKGTGEEHVFFRNEIETVEGWNENEPFYFSTDDAGKLACDSDSSIIA